MLNSSQESLDQIAFQNVMKKLCRFKNLVLLSYINYQDLQVKPYYVATKMTQKKINWKEYSLMVPGTF